MPQSFFTQLRYFSIILLSSLAVFLLSLAFSNFYAACTRTDRGLEAITLSIHPTPVHSIDRRIGRESGCSSLDQQLNAQGYGSVFIYGGHGYFDNMNAFLGSKDYRIVDKSSAPSQSLSNEAYPKHWAVPIDKRFNLYQMHPRLYRSALPDSDALPLLKTLGINTVINFYQRSDASWLHDPRVRQIHLPLHINRLDDSDVIEVLRNIRQAEAQGSVLIHCKHGQHRTGLIAALYRVVYQGWNKQQALAEMRGGFGGEERLDDVELYLRQVDIVALRQALDSGACSTSPWALCAVKARLPSLVLGL